MFWAQLRRVLTSSAQPPFSVAGVEAIVKRFRQAHYRLLAQMSLDDVEALARRLDAESGGAREEQPSMGSPLSAATMDVD